MLTTKESAFIDAYDAYADKPNGTRAAIAAGYAASTAAITASRLLIKPSVAAELAERRRKKALIAGITPETVLMELGKLGFADIRQILSWDTETTKTYFDEDGNEVKCPLNSVVLKNSNSLTPEVTAAIAEIVQARDGSVKIKMHDKLAALVRLGQHFGMFRAPVSAEEPGKKEKAAADAKNSESGTSWDGLLSTPTSIPIPSSMQ